MGKACILIVEDEDAICQIIREALEPFAKVSIVHNGAEGLEQARMLQPDLILLDLTMPGLDGLDVLKKLKSHPTTRTIPVVIVSARGESQALFEGQAMGAVDHVIKPFDLQVLRKVVERQLAMRGAIHRQGDA